jgi:hypothetical protein
MPGSGPLHVTGPAQLACVPGDDDDDAGPSEETPDAPPPDDDANRRSVVEEPTPDHVDAPFRRRKRRPDDLRPEHNG